MNEVRGKTIEHLVIGGGPAGSMAAIQLAEAGCRVTLLERERAAHGKVCGEFLSQEAVSYLDQAGIAVGKLGAVSIDRIRLAAGGWVAEAALRFRALSLSRSVLDEAMLVRAAQAGCAVERGAEVVGLEREGATWRVELQTGGSLHAREVFLATGKHDLRGWERGKGRQSDLVGFKMHLRLQPSASEALRGAMELFLFPEGYGGLSFIESDTVNLCFVVRRTEMRRLGGWVGLLQTIRNANRLLGDRLRDARSLSARPLAIAPIPYGHLEGARSGLWCLGDQAAVIPSFTGDGMSIAMHSAMLAVRMLLEGQDANRFSRVLAHQLRPSMDLATLLSRLLVSGAGRRLVPVCLGVAPSALRWIADATRIRDRDLVRSDGERPGAALPAWSVGGGRIPPLRG